jgi:hypothetical protein
MKQIILYLLILLLIIAVYSISIESLEQFLNVPEGAGKLMITPFSKSFMIEDRAFGWHKWWRDNQSSYGVENDTSFNGTAYETYSKKIPLLYDGVRDVNVCCSYLP